jgi:ubiquinone/menaquinone biosynthesis C-methylase UbiE
VRIRLSLDRWYLGLHGLALLRSYPFGDPDEALRRMGAMRELLEKRGEEGIFEIREYESLETAEAYERWAGTYDDPNPLIRAEEGALIGHLDAHPPGRALDVATGTGRVAFYLVRRGHAVLACDRSEAMLRRTAEKVEAVRLVRAELPDLPFRPESFDLVTCSLALTHVPALGPTFKAFARILKPRGVVIISDVHPFAVLTGAHAFFRLTDDSCAVTRNEQHRLSDYVSAATSGGFTIEACSEARVDAELLREFGVSDDPLDPEQAILGLPFALVWTFRRSRDPSEDRGIGS